LGITLVMHNGTPIIPIEFLKTLLPEPGTLGADTKGKTCIGNWIEGTGKDGQPKRYYVYNICDHQECYRETNSPGRQLHHRRPRHDRRPPAPHESV
jgi:saccharopine dehydrogenase (NAD+, L-lysine-forming)